MTARVSVLERLVAKQTTVSQEWKMLQDAAKATQAQRKQGEACTFWPCKCYCKRDERFISPLPGGKHGQLQVDWQSVSLNLHQILLCQCGKGSTERLLMSRED